MKSLHVIGLGPLCFHEHGGGCSITRSGLLASFCCAKLIFVLYFAAVDLVERVFAFCVLGVVCVCEHEHVKFGNKARDRRSHDVAGQRNWRTLTSRQRAHLSDG